MGKRDRSNEPQKTGRKPVELQVAFKIQYVPLPPERVEAWRSALSLIVDWVVEDLLSNPEEGSNDQN